MTYWTTRAAAEELRIDLDDVHRACASLDLPKDGTAWLIGDVELEIIRAFVHGLPIMRRLIDWYREAVINRRTFEYLWGRYVRG